MSATCACGRVPDQTTPASFWDKMMVLTRYDGTHAADQCQIDQLVTPDRPEQDVLLARIAAALEVPVQWEYRNGPRDALCAILRVLRGES